MSDNLLSARIVTANGQVHDVSAWPNQNPELFWAIRGAGANFGIVTSATYRLESTANLQGEIMSFDFTIPASMSSSFFKSLELYSGKIPAELAAIALVTYNSTIQEAQILTNWIYRGSKNDAFDAIKPILNFGSPVVGMQVPFNKQMDITFSGLSNMVCQDGVTRDIYSASLKTYNATAMVETFEKISEFYDDYPGGRNSTLRFEFYPNQAVAAVPTDQTAWPLRDATGYL